MVSDGIKAARIQAQYSPLIGAVGQSRVVPPIVCARPGTGEYPRWRDGRTVLPAAV